MILKSITLKNYRNYKSQSLVFHPKFNIIHGDNAEGKTNLIEAIYLICNFRPFKQVKNEELINFSFETSAIKGELEADNGLNEVHITIKKEGRHTRLNGKIVYSISRYLGKFKVVLFLPSDIEIIKGSMLSRRKYLDSVISTIDTAYLKDLRDYHKALSQRNFLLSSKKPVSPLSYEIWNEKIAEYGTSIIKKRVEIIKIFNEKLFEVYSSSDKSDGHVEIKYIPSFEENGDISSSII
ncbi:MAG: DNA replication/repair protein RecF, partial [Thermodesulfobacteriota bacterium]